jgi:hypothetical protein
MTNATNNARNDNNTNTRTASNRILVPRAHMTTVYNILNNLEFGAVVASMRFRRDGFSIPSVAMSADMRSAFVAALDAEIAAGNRRLATVRRRTVAAFEMTDARYWALAGSNPTAGFKLGLRAKTDANVSPLGIAM